MTKDELARSIVAKLGDNPTLTINLLASELDTTVDDVAFVLDEYHVTDGEPVHVGPGQGGGWVDEETRAALVKPGESLFIGFRWPDGSLNEEEPFDITNPAHLKAMGLQRAGS